ncbi:MAG: alpha/beta hydrolase [Oscillospiraceae bacterium]|nr:alpha/beta hydrolase [Oscillospiraceae bacterium]
MLDNTKLYYEITGEGQPIVFLHGWSSNHDCFTDVIKIMRDKYRCISYCHRGHGASDVPEGGYTIPQLARDLKELIEYLNLKDVILIGHSMGGYVIYEYIKQFGCNNIKKLVIMDMSPKVTCDNEWKSGAFGTYDEQCLKEDIELIAQDIGKFMGKLKLPDFEELPEIMALLVTRGLKGNNHTLPLIGLWHSMFTRDYRSAVASITVPTAYVIPEHGIYPMSAAKYVKEHAGATVEIIEAPGCSHISMVENPLQTAKDLIEFIREE